MKTGERCKHTLGGILAKYKKEERLRDWAVDGAEWTVSGRKRKKHFSSKPENSGGLISLSLPSSHHTFYVLTKTNKMIR